MDGTTGWSAISGASAATYTAVAGDVGYHLRVKVTYTDGQGSGKMADVGNDRQGDRRRRRRR